MHPQLAEADTISVGALAFRDLAWGYSAKYRLMYSGNTAPDNGRFRGFAELKMVRVFSPDSWNFKEGAHALSKQPRQPYTYSIVLRNNEPIHPLQKDYALNFPYPWHRYTRPPLASNIRWSFPCHCFTHPDSLGVHLRSTIWFTLFHEPLHQIQLPHLDSRITRTPP